MESSNALGKLTFDLSLFDLYKAGLVSRDAALHSADSRNNPGLRSKLSEGMSAETQSTSMTADKSWVQQGRQADTDRPLPWPSRQAVELTN